MDEPLTTDSADLVGIELVELLRTLGFFWAEVGGRPILALLRMATGAVAAVGDAFSLAWIAARFVQAG